MGVPRGYVLGPLLFSLYINDLRDALNDECTEHVLYADELQVYTQFDKNGLSEGVDYLTSVARAVSEWAADNDLRLNIGIKTKATIFGSSQRINMLRRLGLPIALVWEPESIDWLIKI